MAVVSLMSHRRNRHPYPTWHASGSTASSLAAEQARAPQICPPSLFTRTSPLWLRRLRALWRQWVGSGRSVLLQPLTSLHRVRDDFDAALDDLDSPCTDQLRDQIARARSLRELWHLRLNLFDLVALHHGQAAAQARLERLNRHFPTRIQRNGPKGRTVAW